MVYEGAFDTKRLQAFSAEFSKKTKFAFLLLSGVKGQALHLAKLLLMIDFNEHYSGGADSDDDDM